MANGKMWALYSYIAPVSSVQLQLYVKLWITSGPVPILNHHKEDRIKSPNRQSLSPTRGSKKKRLRMRTPLGQHHAPWSTSRYLSFVRVGRTICILHTNRPIPCWGTLRDSQDMFKLLNQMTQYTRYWSH